jgi:Disaggregatase related
VKPPAPKAVLAVVAAFFAGLALTSAAETPTNLITNGSFEGTLAGWIGYKATLALANDGVVGSGAVRVSRRADSTISTYSVVTSPRPVQSTAAGTTYSASAWVRADTPGRTLCLRVREWSATSQVGSASTCLTGTVGWKQFPTLGYTAAGSANQLDLYVFQRSAVAGDSFEADGFSLVASAPSGSTAPMNTSPPSISGSVRPGQTLTGAAGAWSGTTPIAYAYQWRRCDSTGAGCTDLSGATSQSYTLATADVGSTIRLVVTASNVAGSSTATSAATGVVSATAVAPTNTAPPTISGTAQVGAPMTASPGAWSGTSPISYGYQWRRCDATGNSCVGIVGGNAQAYTVSTADVAATLRVAVTATNSAGGVTATSAASAVVVGVSYPSPGPSVGCSKYVSASGNDLGSGTAAAPYRTVQKLVDNLSPGQTGCLTGGGVFTGDVAIRAGGDAGNPVNLTSDPSTGRATIQGYVRILDSANFVTLSNLNIDGSTAIPITLHIYGDNANVSNNDITNRRNSQSCIIIGSSTYGIAFNTVIDHNRIHDCGKTLLDHGIYTQKAYGATRITNNTVYDNVYGFGIKLAPDAQGVLVDHNISDGTGREGLIVGQNDSYSVTTSSNNTFTNNIVTWAARYGFTSYFPSIVGVNNVVAYNCFFGNTSGDFGNGFKGYTEHDNADVDPLFVDRSAHDFRLKAGSPCAGKGPQ